jgi:hypothetical protein
VRITHNIANVPGFRPVLCLDPKLPRHESVAHWGTVRLSGLAAGRFQEPISWVIDEAGQAVAALLLARASDPSLKFQSL